jgi:hypothetical protein
MAWKGRNREGNVDYKRLQTTLVNSKMQQENNALYQAIKGLIDGAQTFRDGVNDSVKKDDKINLKNQVENILSPKAGGSLFGSYLPVAVNGLNITLPTDIDVRQTQFLRAERLVYISGVVFVIPASGATLTTLELSLPVVSNFVDSSQVNGTMAAESSIGTAIVPGLITGNVTLKTANLRFYSVDTNLHDIRFVFSYELL